MLRGFDLIELQADELCTFVGNKNETVWLFATLEVSSRLWAGSVLGRRSDHNARAVINDVVRRGRVVGCPLIATDGFEYYVGAVRALLGSTCVYGQVLKTLGRETRTPAMQAGLATRRLTLRDIFVSLRSLVSWLRDVLTFTDLRRRAAAAVMYMPVAA